ncbi:MAG: hypothetical protein IT158_30070 [Bryobacterales bacterium]|nr:hypothetical protein [Bryobacterales bacterium]
MFKSVYLTLLVGPAVPAPAPRSVIDALTGAQVTVAAGRRSGFQLSFSLSKESLLNTALLPAGYFDPGIRVILVATVNGIPTVLMDGVVTRQEMTASNEPGQSRLTVTGDDLTTLMDLTDNTGMLFPSLPDPAIVALIVAKYAIYGMVPLVIPPLLMNVPIVTDRIPTQSGTDFAFINQLARRNGHVFYLQPGPAPGMNLAYWGPEIRIGIPQPALNVNMDAHSNVESLSFSFDGLSRTQPAIVIQEPFTKLGIPIPVPSFDLLRPPLALRPATALRIEPLNDGAKLNFVEAASRAMARAAESADAVTGNGSLDVMRYGRPLQARGLVGVRGAGLAYDGLYYVKSVTHSLKPGEYKQNFTLARSGLVSLTPTVVP